MNDFWNEAIIPIYFFYGLAFFSMGLVLLIESGRSSELTLSRAIRFLAGFGILHGVHEWMDMLEQDLTIYHNQIVPVWVNWVQLALLVTSFFALFAFGQYLLRLRQKFHPYQVILAGVVSYFVLAIGLQLVYDLNDREWIEAAGGLSRYMVGIPGSTLACFALWRERQTFRQRGMEIFVSDLTVAAIALALYGVFGQIFVSETALPPSKVINTELFIDIFQFPIQLFRAALATIVAFSMIRVLRALEVENQQRIAAMERRQRELEQQSRQELARLNHELKQINYEREQLLAEVSKRDAMRGVLLHRITAAQEAERRRIARELHDDTGQALTGLSMGLRGVATKLEKHGHDHESEVKYLHELEKTASQALGELRLLISDLRPPQLDDMGLAAALRWMLNRFNQHSEIKIDLEITGNPVSLPPEIETTLFRIAQEGLNNIAKHAEASQACLKLDFGESITLKVCDNGKGFDPEVVLEPGTARTAWGLLGIQERASLIDAELSLDSAPGEGTTLTLLLHPEPEGLLA
jgi:signal transduction histidine kinase